MLHLKQHQSPTFGARRLLHVCLCSGLKLAPCVWQERRRSKDPEYYDRVHGSNPAQQRESFAEEAERNAHAARRAGREDTISAEGDRTPAST